MATNSTPAPTVILVTGAWHVPAHYSKVTSALTANNIRVLAPCLPCNNNARPPTATLADDVALIRNLVTQELTNDATQKLTILAHSYGGAVTTSAVADLPTASATRLHVIYMAAFMPVEDESLLGTLRTALGGNGLPWLVPQPDGTLTVDGPGKVFYQDVAAEEVKREAEGLLVAFSAAAQVTGIDCKRAAWRDVPVSYIMCEEDAVLPLSMQEWLVERAKGEGAQFVDVLRLKAGHSPFLSVPDKVVEFVMKSL